MDKEKLRVVEVGTVCTGPGVWDTEVSQSKLGVLEVEV